MKKYSYLVFFLFSSCINVSEEKKVLVKNIGETQGTFYNISYLSHNYNFQNDIDSILKKIDYSLSTYNPESIISAINNNEDIQTDTLFNQVFRKSQYVYHKTGGYFDCTISPLVNFWGFGPYQKERIDSSKISQLVELVGSDELSLLDNRVSKPKSVRIDFNGIAQGYSVDLISLFLEGQGINNYLVEIGGEVRVKGLNSEKKLWRIGVSDPSEVLSGNLHVILTLKDKSLATSGNYRKFYEEDGIKYSHIINPFSGYPAKNKLLSVSVITEDCVLADAYATAFMIMGIEKTKEFLKNNSNIDAYFIYSDDDNLLKSYYSKNFEEYFLN
ncbi:MAG: FAD:protein FMN transferase [Bacteroidota bacterium]|nr:FAD:protein FMN transferase [Bacteroidota bacterium]